MFSRTGSSARHRRSIACGVKPPTIAEPNTIKAQGEDAIRHKQHDPTTDVSRIQPEEQRHAQDPGQCEHVHREPLPFDEALNRPHEVGTDERIHRSVRLKQIIKFNSLFRRESAARTPKIAENQEKRSQPRRRVWAGEARRAPTPSHLGGNRPRIRHRRGPIDDGIALCRPEYDCSLRSPERLRFAAVKGATTNRWPGCTRRRDP